MDHSWRLGDSWSRIVCVGDVHGDLDALLRILIGASVVDDHGRWIARNGLLVLLGDLIERGPDSAAVLSFVMNLQVEAAAARGRVESLIGNHELNAVQGDFRYTKAAEVLALEEFWFDQSNGLHAFYRGESPYARWIRERPTIVTAGRYMFVHAGVDDWPHACDPTWVNQTLGVWVAHFQGVAPEPAESTFWLTDETGPLKTPHFAAEPDAPASPDLTRVVTQALAALRADAMIVGHRPTGSLGFAVAYPHPAFGRLVVAADTGICRFFGGRLSAIDCSGRDIVPMYWERGERELPLTSEIRARAAAERRQVSSASQA